MDNTKLDFTGTQRLFNALGVKVISWVSEGDNMPNPETLKYGDCIVRVTGKDDDRVGRLYRYETHDGTPTMVDLLWLSNNDIKYFDEISADEFESLSQLNKALNVMANIGAGFSKSLERHLIHTRQTVLTTAVHGVALAAIGRVERRKRQEKKV